MPYIYLGGFPPPYGGVTIKNKLLYSKLSEHIMIEQSGFYNKSKNKLSRLWSLFKELLLSKEGLLIGLSKHSLKLITFILYLGNKKLMNNSVVMVMGGTFHIDVSKDKRLQKYLKEFKQLYVETEGMKKRLNSCEINNVSIYPNCREKAILNFDEKLKSPSLRCLFFSLVSLDKGVDNLVSASAILKKKGIKHSVDFYGHIDKNYEDEFRSCIDKNNSLNYYGVFSSIEDNDVYKKLHQYDILIFPTRWKNEGVPGVLVESKIAGLPAIVSNINFNSEIVVNDLNGLVLEKNDPDNLASAIERLHDDRSLLREFQLNAKNSSKDFYIENYINDIIKVIKS